MRWLGAKRWESLPEASFSSYGERGSIDVLAWNEAARTLLVIEVKTDPEPEVVGRSHAHHARRLAPAVARERFGWNAVAVGRVLVLPDERTIRRQVERHEEVLRRAYPMRGHALRKWLEAPAGAASGLLFLPPADDIGTRRRIGPTRPMRVAARGREDRN